MSTNDTSIRREITVAMSTNDTSIRREITVEIAPTPAELARIFAEWYDNDQGAFFSALASEVSQWDGSFGRQMAHVMATTELTIEGRATMRQIGEAATDPIVPVCPRCHNDDTAPGGVVCPECHGIDEGVVETDT